MFNPTRLTLARKRRGHTKSSLAVKLGVDLRAVYAYESGEYPPAEDTLHKIQLVLDFPETFFSGDDLEEPSPDTASFRAMTKMLSGQRDMALETGAIAFHINNWLESKFELPPTDLPDLSDEPTPEVAADSLRRYWSIGEMPIRNMIHLLEAKGVRVYSLAIDAREVDAFSAWKGSTPFVFLNTNKSSEHSRYDAAHELGHLILHRQGSPQGREAERQANLFASAFLMPRASVLAHARPFPTLSRLIELKKIWITSVAALNYRLHEVGLTSDWVYRGLCIEIAKRGYRTKEPNSAPREVSQALQLMLAALRQDGIGRHKMAEALSISPTELDQLLFGLVMTAIEGGRRKPTGKGSEPPGLIRVK
jgi:Zn-dependent peptidase ImmA (M78 family)/transcriptional regulator with XRE-family HTH domain